MSELEDEVVALEAVSEVDNYKDIIGDCDDLFARVENFPELRVRVATVLDRVIGEIEQLDDPVIANYLGEYGSRAYWADVLATISSSEPSGGRKPSDRPAK